MSSQLTAAEKAELRRQKILAKKNARMAYAAGDQSRLPSTAPTETIEPLPTTNTTNSVPTQRMSHSETAPARTESFKHAGPRESGASLPGLRKSALFRGFLLGITAIAFALASHGGMIVEWRVSAVEVFACAELCLLTPQLMKSAQSLFRQSGNGGSAMSALWLMSYAQEMYISLNGVMCDFSAYMVCFLCTWYLLA